MTAFVPEIAARAMIPRDLLVQASALHLAIHVHPRWVAVALADAAGGGISWSEEFDIEQTRVDTWDDSIEFIRARNWSEKVFRKCTLTFDTADFTLVPSAFFQKEKEGDLLEFQTGRKSERVDSTSIPEFNAELVYGIPRQLMDLVMKFPNLRIFPSACLFARFSMMQSTRDEKFMHIWRSPGMMLLCIIQSKQLHLLNFYEAQADEDILYYTANAAMRTGIDLENVHLVLYEQRRNAELQKLLEQYNRQLRIADHQNR